MSFITKIQDRISYAHAQGLNTKNKIVELGKDAYYLYIRGLDPLVFSCYNGLFEPLKQADFLRYARFFSNLDSINFLKEESPSEIIRECVDFSSYKSFCESLEKLSTEGRLAAAYLSNLKHAYEVAIRCHFNVTFRRDKTKNNPCAFYPCTELESYYLDRSMSNKITPIGILEEFLNDLKVQLDEGKEYSDVDPFTYQLKLKAPMEFNFFWRIYYRNYTEISRELAKVNPYSPYNTQYEKWKKDVARCGGNLPHASGGKLHNPDGTPLVLPLDLGVSTPIGWDGTIYEFSNHGEVGHNLRLQVERRTYAILWQALQKDKAQREIHPTYRLNHFTYMRSYELRLYSKLITRVFLLLVPLFLIRRSFSLSVSALLKNCCSLTLYFWIYRRLCRLEKNSF